jgi:molybdopterin-guanine dinucleotide biosynthesis protein A
MGRDKALLPWGKGVLLDHMLARARKVSDSSETLIVGDRPAYHGRGAQVIADLYDQQGPLGGIATALRVAGSRRVLVLAVDMPRVSAKLLNAMCALDSAADVLVPEDIVHDEGQRPRSRLHVLHAIYSQACLEPAMKRLDQDELRVTSFFDEVMVERLEELWLRQFDPALRSFENVNYPEDYGRIQEES